MPLGSCVSGGTGLSEGFHNVCSNLCLRFSLCTELTEGLFPCYSVFASLVWKVRGVFCSSDSASVSAGIISLGLGMSPFQGSSPSPSCSSSSIMYPFPSPWSREFSYNLLQLRWVFSSALRATFPPTSLDPRNCSYFFLTPLPLLVLSYWLLFYRILLAEKLTGFCLLASVLQTCSGPSQPNLFIKQSVLHEPIFLVLYLS